MVEPEYKYLVKKEFCPGCPIYFAPIFPKVDPRRAEVRKEMDDNDKWFAARQKLQGI